MAEFLSGQQSYTVHRRIKKLQFPRRVIQVATSRVRADGDLIELGDLAPWNKGYRYIFTVIDAFSRYLWVVPLKTKEASATATALQNIISKEKFHTLSLYTDGGTEFSGASFQSVLKKAGIKHRICTSDDFHCPFVERVIRTVKEKLFQAMTANFTRTWLPFLPQVVAAYNKTIHSATKMRPTEATQPENYLSVLKQLERRRLRIGSGAGGKKYKFQVGDTVRVLLANGGPLRTKGYLPRYSWEIFRIRKRANDRAHDRPGAPAYILEDLQGELIEHALFYEPELSKIHPDQLKAKAPIREILEEKGDQVKVWWQGFPKAGATWISRSNLV